MQIDQLQIELRPRSNAQALDLGFALLRAHARATYLAWLALLLPLVALSAALTLWAPELSWLWIMLLWWCKPLLERAPLYVLSRGVFGSAVSWRDALRAWPRQLGGGMLSLMTWKRPFCAGRGLDQPIWQLELARGPVARKRIRVLSGKGTGASAIWFGVVCAHLEMILQLGQIGAISVFMGGSGEVNPFALLSGAMSTEGGAAPLAILVIYAIASAIVGPVYIAGCFTLYLNRRASLEAWDIELKLRQIAAPATAPGRRQRGVALHMLGALALLATLLPAAPDTWAAAPVPDCTPPGITTDTRSPFPTSDQVRVRKQLDALYATSDLRGYKCEVSWKPRHPSTGTPNRDLRQPELQLPLLAQVLRVLLIAFAIGLVGWLLYRYRDKLPRRRRSVAAVPATDIGGLDIRAESLPDDVAASVRALWSQGRRRLALALLYRATLSRLVTDDQLDLRQGNTEGDCLRSANLAQVAGRLTRARLVVAVETTSLWLAGAYADRWPDDAALHACCDAWQAQFGQSAEGAA